MLSSKSWDRAYGFLLALWVVALLLAGRVATNTIRETVGQLTMIHRLVRPNAASESQPAMEILESDSVQFGLGLLAKQSGDDAVAEEIWLTTLERNDTYLLPMSVHLPHNRTLASKAVQRYPENARGWEWLGDATGLESPAEALEFYLRAVDLDPANNLMWEKIGPLAESESQLAHTAFRRACDLNAVRNGACFSAARLAFATGDWTGTIIYFERGGYPESALDWARLIFAASQSNQPDKAQSYLSQAQQEYPADYPALLEQLP